MNTPFNDILHTNVVPSEIDSQLIRELLVGPRREVAEITHEIERIRALLEELTGKRELLSDFIEAHEALISPVRRLPEDVVAEIFTACLPSGRNAVMSGEEAPLLLCHVTRTWRHVALSMPRLWASLHIVAPGNLKLHQISEAVDIWLSRSGVLPLSISIVRSCTSKIPTDFSVLLETLIRYSSRWNRMRFSLVSFSSFKPLAVLSPADVPILENVVFDEVRQDVDPIWRPLPLEWSFVAFLGATSLRSVTIRRAEILDHFPLPWNHLRHLSLAEEPASWLTAAQGVAMLRRSPNLETCSLPFDDDDDLTTDLPICRMEHLRELYVVDMLAVTRDFFANLDLPCLRSLEYMSAGVPGDFPFTPLLTSANVLQRLALSVERVTSGTVIGCLRLVPALRELVIRYDEFSFESVALDNSLWTSLTPTAQNLEHVLCPGLQSVKFVEFSATSDNALLEFIQARTGSNFAGIARLSKVQAHFRRRMQVDIAPTLQQAIDDGFDLSLRYEYPSPRTYSPWEQILAHRGEERPSDRWGRVPSSFIAP